MTTGDGLIIVDKPAGWTSHDVVARLRRLAGTKRVGHGGTLDPMATGVLVIGTGKATRLLGHLALAEKEYLATIRLGQATDTCDADGEVISGAPAAALTLAEVRAAAQPLSGDIQQVPPAISAVKIAGTRAYRLARAGTAAVLPPRPVTVFSFVIESGRTVGDELLDVDVAVRCSSGTYIRALARDLGEALGVGGHVAALRRTRAGAYDLSMARSLAQLEAEVGAQRGGGVGSAGAGAQRGGGAGSAGAGAQRGGGVGSAGAGAQRGGGTSRAELSLIPLARAAADAFPSIQLTGDQARLLSHGGRLPGGAGQVPGYQAAFGPDGTLIALVEDKGGQTRPVVVFAPGAD